MVGTGEAADKLLAPGLRLVPDTALTAVHSRGFAKAAEFARKHAPQPAAVAVYDKYAELLADTNVDAVILATPDALHAEQAIAAARARKHVFVEKPMATDFNDACAMVGACSEAGVKLGVGYHHRQHLGHQALRRAIAEGSMGRVHQINVQWSRPSKYELRPGEQWRSVGSEGRWWAMAALGTHCLDTALYLLEPQRGASADDVRATFSSTRFKTKRDETAQVTLKTKDGTIINVVTSVTLAYTKRIEIFCGLGGKIVCEETFGPHGGGLITIDGTPLEFQKINPYAAELADFADAIREDRRPAADGLTGLLNVSLLCAAERDARRCTA